MANDNVWCLTIDLNNKPIGAPFQVLVENDTNIVKVKVKEEMRIQQIAPLLEVWRPTTKLNDGTLEDQVNKFFSETKVKRLSERKMIADLEISDDETLLVKVLSMFPLWSFNPAVLN
jgi:hypothetical protein